MPAEFDGFVGWNRVPVSALQAELSTDLQAVRAWIAIRGARSEATRRAYRREAGRLLLWAIVETAKGLLLMKRVLADPRPAECTVGGAG
ncbi:hypothetical protein [Burkholderia gladioli]|uniref:hypothetical protein n=1 Tax=Burkholderia gladioli TaxID=28095 RepID=UPI003D21288C